MKSFFTTKRVATESEDQGELEETNGEGGEISTTASQPAEVAELPVKPTASTSTTVRKFRLYYYHNNLTQTICEMTQFKMSCGTFDPLSIISRLNTASQILMSPTKVSAVSFLACVELLFSLPLLNVDSVLDSSTFWPTTIFFFVFTDEKGPLPTMVYPNNDRKCC